MPASLILIVATERHLGIGKANTLPWKLPEDMAHFKAATMGHAILMGRKTFESIGKPLPGRDNIVITRNPDWTFPGVKTAASLQDAVALASGELAYVIGGAEIYRAALPLAEQLDVTHIDHDFSCDAFFPAIDATIWTESSRSEGFSEKAQLHYAFVTYRRIAASAL